MSSDVITVFEATLESFWVARELPPLPPKAFPPGLPSVREGELFLDFARNILLKLELGYLKGGEKWGE